MGGKVTWTGFSGDDDESFAVSLRQMGGYITGVVNDKLEAIMTDVRDTARNYAPVDEGNLEDAIKLQKADNRRLWTVYVDEGMPGTRADSVGDYAIRMHEDPTYRLGSKSQAKAAALGVTVGYKFLERAFNDKVNDKVIRDLQETLDKAIEARKK